MTYRLGKLSLEAIEILQIVYTLGDQAYPYHVQQAFEATHGNVHKQNFRRTLEKLCGYGYLKEERGFERPETGRPRMLRHVISPQGIAALRELEKRLAAQSAAIHALLK